MKEGKSIIRKITFLLFWLVSTGISVLIAYWLMAAVPVTEEGGYFSRLLSVLHNPFADYFNNYTPIGMIIAFIVVELLFGIRFISKMTGENVIQPEPIEQGSNEMEKASFTDNEIFAEEPKVQFVEQTDEKPVKAEQQKKERQLLEKEDVNEDIFLKEDLFLKLFNSGYSMNQINAMMELTTYIPNIDEIQMVKTFTPSMTEEEIRDYIEMFFG